MLTLFWTVLFCLGWRIVTDEGQILYFIRKPFDDAFTNKDCTEERLKLAHQINNKSLADALNKTLLKHKLIIAIGKPFVLCITCFSSVWGVSVFISLNGISDRLTVAMILNSFSAAFLNTLIWSFYVRYIQ